jgi:hypothetical protein
MGRNYNNTYKDFTYSINKFNVSYKGVNLSLIVLKYDFTDNKKNLLVE